MARAYAGFLGSLGMTVALARGAVHGAGFEGTVLQAVIAMAALAAVGAVVGSIATSTVDEAIRSKLQQQLADANEAS